LKTGKRTRPDREAVSASDRIELWFWELKDELTAKWRRTRYRMTEEDARTRHGDNARKVEGTLEIRKGDPPIRTG
jgi:hypothetical protein